MARAEASIVINRPVKEVGDYLDDPERHVEWGAGTLEYEKTSEGPTAVGSTYRGAMVFLGRRHEWTSEVVEFEPHKKTKQSITSGPLAVEETYILEPVEGGTRFTIVMEGEPRGFFKLADPLVVRLLQRTMEGNLASLKEILEAQG
jgi:hypothetical protein